MPSVEVNMGLFRWLIEVRTTTGPTCTVCRRALPQRYLIGPEHQAFCPSHDFGLSFCCICSSPIPPSSQGLPYCLDCRRSAVGETREAEALLGQVQRDLRDLGLPWWPQRVPVNLAGVVQAPHVATIHWQELQDAQGRRRVNFQEIRVKPGHPRLYLGSLLAHELGHAFLVQHSLGTAPPEAVEGFCELCGWLWLGRQQDPRVPRLRARMEKNTAPIYGDGLRMMLRLRQAWGLDGIIREMKARGGRLC